MLQPAFKNISGRIGSGRLSGPMGQMLDQSKRQNGLERKQLSESVSVAIVGVGESVADVRQFTRELRCASLLFNVFTPIT